MRRQVLPLAAAALSLAALPGVAAAQETAIVTTDLNMRAGPSISFPVVEVIPDNSQVTVFGCVRDYEWCDVVWRDARGWVSASYLEHLSDGTYVPIVEYGPTVGLPIVTFSVETYWDRHYRHRPWYRERVRWYRFWRDERRDQRADRRRERRDEGTERRESRREGLIERRQERRADRAERRVGVERRTFLRAEPRGDAGHAQLRTERRERPSGARGFRAEPRGHRGGRNAERRSGR
ncbi:MAG TPA: SH3 domain-containing protein [Hyphomicrobiaceae bacterium]|nr:SH3 domain-containing protein [Hyphomicrobiaceae bacterium]